MAKINTTLQMSFGKPEMVIEKMAFNTDSEDAAKAARRMALICADPKEQALYRFNPNGARNNRHPGQPFDDDASPPYSE